MVDSTHLHQICPTCGRQLQVRLDYLDQLVACDHCGGQFVAELEAPRRLFSARNEWATPLARRVDKLLAVNQCDIDALVTGTEGTLMAAAS